ncbi:MAG TPA: methyltransferase domain-containing protein [Woeseiaceae bacterium]|nr:methyltransferase domain-containing protein [Woeseiaceae bacterium]
MVEHTKITPALRFDRLTPLYDHIVRYTTRERRFKSILLKTAAIKRGESILDVGCGTGTLLQSIAEQQSAVQLTGLDADPAILAIADRKLSAANISYNLVLGRSTDMAFDDETFDRVVSTLFFHHLVTAEKRATVAEIARVLRPGGAAHIADWGRPTGPLQRLAFYQIQLLDGFASTRDHVAGKLTSLFSEAGFQEVEEFAHLRTVFGTLRFISAVKPLN